MRLLVIGGSGLVGSHVVRSAISAGHEVIGTFRERSEPRLVHLDAANLDEFEGLLDRHNPDWVVHAAGWTWVDGCESDPVRAMEENCHQPARLARRCADRGIRFAYFSTSYIFDGKEGPYNETATPNPINVYARSKWEAEQRLTELTSDSVLLPRVICVFGEEARRKNFACQVCDAMKAGKAMVLPSDQLGNPTWAGDIGAATVDLIAKGASGPWHLGGANPDCSRLDWAIQLVAGFQQAGVTVHPGFQLSAKPTTVLAQKALRPIHAGMVSSKLPTPCLPPVDYPSICRRVAGFPA